MSKIPKISKSKLYKGRKEKVKTNQKTKTKHEHVRFVIILRHGNVNISNPQLEMSSRQLELWQLGHQKRPSTPDRRYKSTLERPLFAFSRPLVLTSTGVLKLLQKGQKTLSQNELTFKLRKKKKNSTKKVWTKTSERTALCFLREAQQSKTSVVMIACD